MQTAIISDIHGNIDALNVVIADIEARGVDRIVCLGDIIGYGPNPLECLDTVIDKCDFAMMGNHDFAVLYEPTSFNTTAEAAAFWTRKQFEEEPDADMRRKRYEYLGNLLVRKWEEGTLYVHASPRRPINEYIFPDDVVSAPNKMSSIFDRITERCFVGHTHVTGVFTDEPDFYPPADLGGAYKWGTDDKAIVNPGSVGQPRDRDPRASYAIMTDEQVEFVRLEYDVNAVVEKVKAIDDLSDFLGQRLVEGR
ncbi:metallophosphoesterase family protein [Phycisphaeraceae bacterium D3-23]